MNLFGEAHQSDVCLDSTVFCRNIAAPWLEMWHSRVSFIMHFMNKTCAASFCFFFCSWNLKTMLWSTGLMSSGRLTEPWVIYHVQRTVWLLCSHLVCLWFNEDPHWTLGCDASALWCTVTQIRGCRLEQLISFSQTKPNKCGVFGVSNVDVDSPLQNIRSSPSCCSTTTDMIPN